MTEQVPCSAPGARAMRIGRVWRSPGLLPLLILWVVLAPCPCAAAAGPGNARYVVVLYPENNDGSPGQLLVDRSIRSTFATGSPEPVEVHNEYLDVSPARDAGFRQLQVEYLRRKYAGRKVDLVIVGLSSALDYALENRQQLFPGVPIVLCADD